MVEGHSFYQLLEILAVFEADLDHADGFQYVCSLAKVDESNDSLAHEAAVFEPEVDNALVLRLLDGKKDVFDLDVV